MKQVWRRMLSEDLPVVYTIANHIHNELHEDMCVFIERFSLCPEGCFFLEDTSIRGYLISHPFTQGKSPPLNTLLHQIVDPDCWYIHDLAILEPYRGQGSASKILRWLEKRAMPLTLTSVSGSESFWRKQGFVPDLSVQCPTYGECVYMIKLDA